MIKIAPNGLRYVTHTPGADLDYSIDWSAWLAAGEKITASEWTAATGISLSRKTVELFKITTAFAAGGVAGNDYTLTNTITTSAGRIDSRTITLQCRAR